MRKIKNFDELAKNDARRAALEIAEAGLEAIDTRKVLHDTVKLNGNTLSVASNDFSLEKIKRFLFVGVGKCTLDAAAALEDILGDKISSGVAVDVKTAENEFKKIKSFRGTHPLPTQANVEAAEAVVGILGNLTKDDLVLFVISGGGSTLLCLPEDMGCREEASIIQAMIRAGAKIQEINTVRKHLSLARGGYLAKYAFPAQVVSLIFSDVPGDDIQFIASGPTVMDTTTIEDAGEILARYNILNTCGMEKCGLIETPKEDKYFENVHNVLTVSNSLALAAMKTKAEELGFAAMICTSCLKGEARDVGLAITKELHAAGPKTALLYGGETTVTVRGRGRGGRNLELALSAMRDINEGELVMSVASDGIDNGPFAGAICDTMTKKAAVEAGLALEDFLRDNNGYPLFEKIGNYLMTGDTGSNVSDLMIAVKT
ncbi:MAG: DUF4147 domain-containing protein [Candidatus Liptonbacteria bacterium]|nr:DUF4147 domain-containing protein [Candidatus Liptonbacteria bacterium]